MRIERELVSVSPGYKMDAVLLGMPALVVAVKDCRVRVLFMTRPAFARESFAALMHVPPCAIAGVENVRMLQHLIGIIHRDDAPPVYPAL